jgi:hypothetical protein
VLFNPLGELTVPENQRNFATKDNLPTYPEKIEALKAEGAKLVLVYGIGRMRHIAFWEPTFAADYETVEEWEKGIPLETAFEKNRLFKENTKLFAEIEKMKNEKIKDAQKIYAKEHAPGSGTSAAGVSGFDEFVEGLFKDY